MSSTSDLEDAMNCGLYLNMSGSGHETAFIKCFLLWIDYHFENYFKIASYTQVTISVHNS